MSIAILFLIILIIASVKDWKKGIIFYAVFSMISPHIKLNRVQLSFEIIAFFPLVFILVLKNSKIFAIYSRWKYRQLLWIYIVLLFISSLLSMALYNAKFPIIPLFGYFRGVCMIYILQALYKVQPNFQIDNIIAPVLLINFITSVVQLLMPNTVQLFHDLYFKASLTPLNEVLKLGYFNRAYGTFGTPVLLGVFSLLSFALYIGLYIEKEDIKMLRGKILLSGITGVMALSKTAIIGIPGILIVTYLLIIMGIIRVKNKKIFILPLIISVVGYLVTQILIKLNTTILYYIKFLSAPFKALASRYSTNTGILSETYEVIWNNLIVGVGPIQVGGVFIGDSMYVGILYTTGILGFLIYFGIFTLGMINVIRKRKTVAILCGIAFLLAGLAAPIQLGNISAVFMAYLFADAELKKTNVVNDI